MNKPKYFKIFSIITGCLLIVWINYHQKKNGFPLFVDKYNSGGEISFFWLVAAGLIGWPFIDKVIVWLWSKTTKK